MTLFELPQDGLPTAKFSKPLLSTAKTQAEFDLQFYDRILARNGNHVDALRQQVELMARQGLYGEALELDQRLVELVPTDAVARYNLACSLAMLGQIEEAITALDLAISLGYDDLAHIDADSDLDPLREYAEFFQVLDKHGFF